MQLTPYSWIFIQQELSTKCFLLEYYHIFLEKTLFKINIKIIHTHARMRSHTPHKHTHTHTHTRDVYYHQLLLVIVISSIIAIWYMIHPNCDWICKKASHTCNYKYLEISIWNIQFVISRECTEQFVCISPLIYSNPRPFTGWTLQWIASWNAHHFR